MITATMTRSPSSFGPRRRTQRVGAADASESCPVSGVKLVGITHGRERIASRGIEGWQTQWTTSPGHSARGFFLQGGIIRRPKDKGKCINDAPRAIVGIAALADAGGCVASDCG